MATELELKFYADEAVHQRVLAELSVPAQKIEMETTYYDTPSRAFSARKFTFRRRLENGVSVCTLKTPLQGLGRGEWEVNAPDVLSAIPALLKKGAPEILGELAKEGLTPICGARFTRQALLIKKESFAAELALDKGILTGGGKEMPMCELELEFKGGDIDGFLVYCRTFAALYRLRECKESKFRRANRLALGE